MTNRLHHITLHIVPRVHPAIDGVGDYALLLARELRNAHGIDSRFFVTDPAWSGPRTVEGFEVATLTRHGATDLRDALDRQPSFHSSLVHFVGYGYEKRGCPFWLVNGLTAWRRGRRSHRLVTMFHEIFAPSRKPWTSSFWLAGVQYHLSARLARLSDGGITNRQDYASILHRMRRKQGAPFPALPVFSTVGEPVTNPPLRERPRHLVVFGSTGHRSVIFRQNLSDLETVCHRFEIEKIIDIGARLDLPNSVGGIPIESVGPLAPAGVSARLTGAIIGFFNYNTEFLAKSTTFAAYASHGLIPIGIPWSEKSADGLVSGRHYLPANDAAGTLETGQRVADEAVRWYHSHALAAQGKVFAQILTGLPNS